MTIGERISKIRKDRNLSQEAFGLDLGVSRQAISKWESDANLPDVEKLILISKTYGVSIGWILGTEEEEDLPDGALTAQQEKMVNEIVKRYIDALEEKENERKDREKKEERRSKWDEERAKEAGSQQPENSPGDKPKKKTGIKVLKFVAAAAVLIWCVSLSGKISNLEFNYSNLQNSIGYVQRSVDTQINSITSRVEEILKSQNSLLADYGVSVSGCDLGENTVDLAVFVIPKTYVSGTEVNFLAKIDENTTISAQAEEKENHRFEAVITCRLTDEITVSCEVITESKTETQVMDCLEYLLSASYPETFGIGISDIWNKKVSEINKSSFEDTMSLSISDSDFYGQTVKTVSAEYIVLVNGKEVYSHVDKTLDGYDGRFIDYRFKPNLSVKEGDIIIYYARITDNFGRCKNVYVDGYEIIDGVAELLDNAGDYTDLFDGTKY